MTENQIKEEIREIKRLITEHRYKKGFYRLGALLEEVDRLDETDTDDIDLANEFEIIRGNFNTLNKEKAKGVPIADEKFTQMNWSIISFLDEVKRIAIEYAKPEEERKPNTFVQSPEETLATNIPATQAPITTNPNQADADISLAHGKYKLNFKSLVAILVFLLVLILGIPMFYCPKPPTPPTPPTPEEKPVTTPPVDTMTTTPPEIAKALGPDGKELNFEEASAEHKLADFLSDPNQSLPSKVIKIVEATFSKNSSRLNSNSYKALNNIAEVLKEYPNARIDIYGYIGDDESGNGNKEISLDDTRARAVYNYLKSRGIQEDRLNFEGNGIDEKDKISIRVISRE